MSNLLMTLDSYKASHKLQYPKGTNKIYSYFTARGSRIEGINKTVFWGLRYYIEKYLKSGITKENVDEFLGCMRDHLGEDAISQETIDELRALENKGYLPLHIKALPELTEVPMQVPLFTITNTDDRYYWLTNFIETLLCKVYYTSTLATMMLRLRRMGDYFAKETCDNNSHVDFQFHNFGARGMHSEECARIASLTHLLYFKGTDSVCGLPLYKQMFGKHNGYSCPASEHSISCMFGPGEGEYKYLDNMLTSYPKGIVSVVIDSYDTWDFVTKVVPALKDKILAREGKTVLRPDSSPLTPYEIVMGDKDAPEGSPENKGVLQLLWEQFGGTVNSKGYKVLDPHIGLIYGDAISYEMADKIFRMMTWRKFASSNIVFGVGSWSQVMLSRDIFNYANKASYGEVNHVGMNIHKDPKTDSKKKSAKGLLYVGRNEQGEYFYEQEVSPEREAEGLLRTVYKDGKLYY